MNPLLNLLDGGISAEKTYVDDVFSAYTYTGNGAAQTINNGIDLAGNGGLVWSKRRSAFDHSLVDSVRGGGVYLSSNSTSSGVVTSQIASFNSTGYSLVPGAQANTNNIAFLSYTFARAKKFFDVVAYTGTGVARSNIPHNLNIAPGLIIVKRTSGVNDSFAVYHSGMGAGFSGTLDGTYGINASGMWNNTAPTSTMFSVGTSSNVNSNGVSYIAYLFANDTGEESIIKCGTYVGNGSASGPVVALGWEPQFLLIKSVGYATNWKMLDTTRGITSGGADFSFSANSSAGDATSSDFLDVTANGFSITTSVADFNTSGETYIYMAIRRSNKPPTSGTQVYNAIARAGNLNTAINVTGVGFSPDVLFVRQRATLKTTSVFSRLTGAGACLKTAETSAEYTASTDALESYDMDGVRFGDNLSGNVLTNYGSYLYINHFFKRAPGVFDVVCYTGTGVAHTEAHGLGVVPELMIVKSRSAVSPWGVFLNYNVSNYDYFSLNTNQPTGNTTYAANYYLNGQPTSSGFRVGADSLTNASVATYVCYLFATKAGISKVGSYTGNGSSQNIDCGFAAGARFILIRRTDAAGDWYVWDSARGIVAGNDPHLSLNTTAAEVTTDDSIDPLAAGFIVNQVAATNINVNAATYIYLAIA